MAHTTTERTSARVRAVLAERRLTGRWLANHMAVPPSTLNRRLTGQYPWTLTELDDVARVLELPVAELIVPGERR